MTFQTPDLQIIYNINSSSKEETNEQQEKLREIIQESKNQIVNNIHDDETSSVDSYSVQNIKDEKEEEKEKEIQARVRQLRKIKLLYAKQHLIVLYKIYFVFVFVNLKTGIFLKP